MKILRGAIGAGRGFALIALLAFGISNAYSQTDDPCQLAMDVDSDGVIGITDLLGLLAYFGNSDLDFDCIWDNIDPCVNGEGDCTEEMSGPCEGLAFVEYNGYDYALVEVGDDCWFAENLRTEVYANGDSITTNLEIGLEPGEGYYPALGNHGWTWTSGEVYTQNFGRLYSPGSALDSRGLCPTNWHVSQDADWFVVEALSGISDSLLTSYNFRGEGGVQMKSTQFWTTTSWGQSGTGTNLLGLDIRPGSIAQPGTTWNNMIGTHAWFYTSTPSVAHFEWYPMNADGQFFNQDSIIIYSPIYRELWHGQDGVRRLYGGLGEGFAAAIRCVKNPAPPGEPCNDGIPYTHYDIWPEDGTGNCMGVMSVDHSGSGPCNGEYALEYNDISYPLIERDGRCWFRSNLETMTYANGDSIEYADGDSWGSTTIGQVTDFNHMGLTGNPNWKHLDAKLYNWAAASDERGICPSGWQIPSEDEWNSLAVDYGNPPELKDVSGTNLLGEGWGNPLNSGGFSVLEVGHLYNNIGNQQQAYFWTRDEAWPVMKFGDGFFEATGYSVEGNTIRCVKDLE